MTHSIIIEYGKGHNADCCNFLIVMLSVVYAECGYAECRYAECRYAEYHYAVCHCARQTY
jgi:hypothetical protein